MNNKIMKMKMKMKMMAYKNSTLNTTKQFSTLNTTKLFSIINTKHLLNRLFQKIERTAYHEPYPGLIIASYYFNEPYPLVNEISLLSLTTMDILNQFAYSSLSGYTKFTISLTMKRSFREEITFTLTTNGSEKEMLGGRLKKEKERVQAGQVNCQ